MKKWLYPVVLSFTMVTLVCSQASDKIAVVNISSIFQQSPQRAIVTKQLENEFQGRATELQAQERNLQAQMQLLQRNSSTMQASERNALEKSIIEQRNDFSNKAQSFEQDNRRRQTEERNKILSRIQRAVNNIAGKYGYDIIIDTNAVAYASNAKDITADVLKQVK